MRHRYDAYVRSHRDGVVKRVSFFLKAKKKYRYRLTIFGGCSLLFLSIRSVMFSVGNSIDATDARTDTGANNIEDDLDRKTSSNGAKSLHSLTAQMQSKIPSLPPPQWPQLDRRTSQAIADGLVLGVEGGSNRRYHNTIGSLLYFILL